MVMNERGEGGVYYQFQVGYMLNPEFNSNKAFKEQVENIL